MPASPTPDDAEQLDSLFQGRSETFDEQQLPKSLRHLVSVYRGVMHSAVPRVVALCNPKPTTTAPEDRKECVTRRAPRPSCAAFVVCACGSMTDGACVVAGDACSCAGSSR